MGLETLSTVLWMAISILLAGLAPEASRFFKHFLLVFMIQNTGGALFRLIAGACRTMNAANTGGILGLFVIFILGGFMLPRTQIPNWWEWGYWLSSMSYGFKAFSINEFLAPRWMNKRSLDNATTLGEAILENHDIPTQLGLAKNWFWNWSFSLILALFANKPSFLSKWTSALGKPQAIISKEAPQYGNQQLDERSFKSLISIFVNVTYFVEGDKEKQLVRNQSNSDDANVRKKGMILPFTPLAMSFDSVNYFVDMPQVTATFRPGVLTALMGISGAGKTTLMDVLAGRKTSGYVERDIRISGFPKKQETFARISGYCEQTDLHSPNITVHESLIYSAFLRLPKEVTDEEKMIFVREVMELVELDNLKDGIVGHPGVSGLSTEQRKRLTISVELVANPSIIFMDEPTSGLDARAAAIVMRAVRNTVDTRITVVCTIHQPSIDIFESFDELLLMKRGWQVIYAGPLGRNSQKIIEFFEHFKSSTLYQRNKALVKELSTPPPGAVDLSFGTQYSQSSWGQFKSCVWKMWWSYWRNLDYNLVRNIFTLIAALMVRESNTNLTTIVGALYAGIFFVGMNNCQTVQPVVASERTVFYRERAAGMYSTLPYCAMVSKQR
ncbi:ABC transporter G family member 35-like protein [Tanacetum coccineum]